MWEKSILGLSPTQVYCFWKSEPHLETSDSVTFTPASYREGMQGNEGARNDIRALAAAAGEQKYATSLRRPFEQPNPSAI